MSIVMNRAPVVDMTPVEEHLGDEHFCGWGGNFAWVVDPVATYCEPCLIGFGLFGSYCANKLPVGNVPFLLVWYLVLVYEFDGVGGVLDPASMPFANWPKLLANKRLHACLYFVLLINCL
jgi:hypothetical protein